MQDRPRWPGPGDLGRRVRGHREALGLSHEELAARARVHPGYLEYLEENPALVAPAVLRLLARALQTTPEALLGSSARSPVGSGRAGSAGPAGPGAAPGELAEEECWALLGDRGLGRVVLERSGRVLVHPVTYARARATLLVRTHPGTALDDVASGGGAVGLEVDHLDEVTTEGWSVLVQGPGVRLGDEEGLVVVSLAPERVTGRRLVPA